MGKNWKIEKNGFEKQDIELHGSKFLIGNGYMGYRGTMEEYGAKELVALNMAGLFDKNGDMWRESVNAPNPLFTAVFVNGTVLSPDLSEVISHEQVLDMKKGIHTRKSVFKANGAEITIEAERFVSMKREHIMALKYTIMAKQDVVVQIKSGIDTNVWDINGPHLVQKAIEQHEDKIIYQGETIQNAIPLSVYEFLQGMEEYDVANDCLRVSDLKLLAGKTYEFTKIAGVYWGDGIDGAEHSFDTAIYDGYQVLKSEHTEEWAKIWSHSDVVIEGDDEAQLALRYSIYHLNTIAPRHTDKCGIPARGLSGQVYKGASFWDTEMFMLPFYYFTNPTVAKNLVKYRIHTLEGAKRKAKEFGHEGAFFAWESQETGDDACTLFNITDVFTDRPLRTYFKDKQIHVSADIVYAMWNYCVATNCYDVLCEGGLELMYQCVWFFYTYAAYRGYKGRYELLDVVGPDEYHERVDNNAFTNGMVYQAVNIFLKAVQKVKKIAPQTYDAFVKERDIEWAYDFAEKLYVPEPNEDGIIEQFDGYFKLEDVQVEDVRKREIKENEYWGCHGIASTTRVLKQADVIMLLSVLQKEYSEDIKKANWEFYEPYTEHGSSLSACAYAIVAANIGYTEWAYRYFMKTACVDLKGDSRQYLGSLYIGGTHPAANGGSWNTAIFGFAGVTMTENSLDVSPKLPEQWKKLSFKLNMHDVEFTITIQNDKVEVVADKEEHDVLITVNGKAQGGRR